MASNRKSRSTTSIQLKDAVPHDRISIRMIENVLLIWLDGNIDDKSSDCRDTIAQLRRAVNTIHTFTDSDQCVQFLKDMGDEKACMIISGALGQHIVPQIHNMFQVDSIFIFCGNKKYHEQWTKDWSKIKGIFTEIAPICDALKKAAKECEQNATPFSLVDTNGDLSNRNLDELEPMFMYSQILKEILLVIKFEHQHFMEFIHYCREVLSENEYELKNLEKFEKQYHNKTPIWWYTYECFLYPMLNRALRVTNLDVIIKMGFYVADLHRHIEELHEQQFTGNNSKKILKVYRGQGMSKEEFKKVQKTLDGLISFNNFLSTSKKQEVSLDFARRALFNPDMVGILFVMIVDPSKSTTPFASVIDVGYFGAEEDEILFAMHTIFRIRQIKPMIENPRLFQVELELTDENDQDLRTLTNRIRQETFPESTGWYRLGSVLLSMAQYDKAQQIYEMLLEQKTDEDGKAPIYYQLGLIKDSQGEYKEALRLYENAIEIYKKTRTPNDPDLAMSYNNVGMVYDEMNEYLKALSYYEKALEIRQESLHPNHPDLGMSYNNIGAVYYNMGKYSEALSCYEKGFAVLQKSLPSSHPDLAASYDNMGLVYENMGNYSKAQSCYERAVAIAQKSLPSNHPNLQRWKRNLEDINKKL